MLRFVVPAVSGAIVATPAVLVPYLINVRAEDAAQSLRAGDREPENLVALPPVVALVIEGNYNWSKQKPFCETLCLRLLFNSMVARVIAVDPARGSATSAFWIERRESCPERANFNFGVRWKTDFPFVRGDTPEDRVRARIAGGECLLEGDGRPEEAAMTISYRTVQEGINILARPTYRGHLRRMGALQQHPRGNRTSGPGRAPACTRSRRAKTRNRLCTKFPTVTSGGRAITSAVGPSLHFAAVR